MFRTPNRRIILLALAVLFLDQLTKQLVIHMIESEGERVVIRGFFKFVHWNNTGAAWSMFMGNNGVLAVIAVMALITLFFTKHHFEAHTLAGQIALGFIFGGISGNLLDRIRLHHVTDFIYFYMQRRGASEIYFPAFNVADSAICVGVGLMFLLSLKADRELQKPAQPQV
jgi:signal peptidase II